MQAFFQSQFVFARRPWKAADPKSHDAIGVGAFNLIRRDVYVRIGSYERMRLEVLDDMRLGELVKQEGFRQRVAFGRGLLRLRWVFGATGMVEISCGVGRNRTDICGNVMVQRYSTGVCSAASYRRGPVLLCSAAFSGVDNSARRSGLARDALSVV